MTKIGGTTSMAIVLTAITVVAFPVETPTIALILIVYLGAVSGAVAAVGGWLRMRSERAQPAIVEKEADR